MFPLFFCNKQAAKPALHIGESTEICRAGVHLGKVGVCENIAEDFTLLSIPINNYEKNLSTTACLCILLFWMEHKHGQYGIQGKGQR